MNNVNEFYKRKELLNTVENLTINRDIVYITNQGDYLVIKFNNDLDPVLGAEDRQALLDFIKDELVRQQKGIAEYAIKKLKENVSYSRKQVRKDFELNDLGGK